MFLHLPVNHPLRGLYRFLGGLTGLYVLVFGIAGLVVSRGHGPFARGDIAALGLHTNAAFSVLSMVAGAVILLAAIIDNNLDHHTFLFGGLVFLGVGLVMLAFMQTSLNLLNFTVSTCVVSFLIGLVLFTAGLYTRSGPVAQSEAEERRRHFPTTGQHFPTTGQHFPTTGQRARRMTVGFFSR
jgi:hypothetical protein